MKRNIIRTAHFRLASLYAIIFSMSVLVLGIVLYVTIPQSMETQLKYRIEADIQQLLGDYHDDGIEELRHDIRERIENNQTNRLRYTIINMQGRAIFDRLGEWPHEDGWHKTEQNLLLRVQKLDDDYILAVGGDIRPIIQIKETMLHGFSLAFILTLCLGVMGGVFISSRFLRRLDMLNKKAEAIGAGDLSQRLDVSSHQDDFDYLAVIMNQMLDKIEILIGDMKQGATNLAHDLRTPLSRLRTYLDDLRHKDIDKKDVDQAIAQLDDVLESFSALMRIAELRHADKTKGFEMVNLSQTVNHVCDAYQAVIEDQKGILERSIDTDLMIKGDRSLLMQLLSNLIENALKYGGDLAHITVHLGGDETHLVLDVRDHGQGIPANQRGQVLKPFYRLDQSRHTKGHGLGLGLVKAIADLHGGLLELSDAQPGLRIILRMPL
jgi:signal transduction histidine kinase